MVQKSLKMFLLLFVFLNISLNFVPQKAICEGGGGSDITLTHKVKTEGLSPFNKWWVDMYNDNRILYAACVTGVMLFLGIVVGFGTDFILRLFGFKTTKIVHHE